MTISITTNDVEEAFRLLEYIKASQKQTSPVNVQAPVSQPVPLIAQTPANGAGLSVPLPSSVLTQQGVPAQPVIQTPVIAAQPAIPVAQAPVYTLDQLSAAASALMDAGKRNELLSLLGKFNVQAMTMLSESQYGAFATELRHLGAKL